MSFFIAFRKKESGLNAPRHKGLDFIKNNCYGSLIKRNNKYHFNIILDQNVSESNEYTIIEKFANKFKTLSIESNGFKTAAIFLKNYNQKPEKIVEKERGITITQHNEISNLPVSQIYTDEKRFQNRTKLNESVVKNIVDNYDATQFDPIILWYDKNAKKYFVLAGHHRFEALKQLDKKTAPVKIAYYTEEKAIQYAKVESNANRSLELPQERAKIYRDLRKKGSKKTAIIADAKKLEGKNANYIVNLSYLKINGLTLSALDQLSETTDKQNATIIEKMADWIGEAKRNNDNLTDAHEKEMFDFLQDKEASKRISSKSEFLQKISSITSDLYFDNQEALNLKRFKYQSEGEAAYDKEYSDLKAKVDAIIANRTNLVDRIKNPNNKDYIKPSSPDYNAVLKALDTMIEKYGKDLKTAQEQLIALSRKKRYYTSAGANQVGFFGTAKTKETIAFNKQILLAKRKGLLDSQVLNLVVCKGELSKFAGKHKILISGKIIKKTMTKDKNHSLTFEHYINLPDTINEPIAIFKSLKVGYVVLTEILDELNKPLMVAIHFNEVFKVQDIRSIYSKKKMIIPTEIGKKADYYCMKTKKVNFLLDILV